MDRKNRTIWLVFLLTSAIIAGGVLWYTQKIIRETEVMQSEVMKRGEEMAERIQQNRVKKEENKQQTNEDLVWYEIPEMRIKMKFRKDFANDLVYKYYRGDIYEKDGHFYKETISLEEKKYIQPFQEQVKFSLKSIQKIAEKCTVENSFPVILIKQDGNMHEWGSQNVFWKEISKQFNTFFVFIDMAENPKHISCYETDEKVQIFIQEQLKIIIDAFSTITPISS